MTVTIALAGKGGTGKTTVAAMVIRLIIEEQLGMVIAIDADPSSNLNMVLGLELDETVGDIREEMLAEIKSTVGAGALAGGLSSGMSKNDYFDYHIRMATVEGDGVDLIAMGRPEGQGCYCAANNVMRTVMDRISANYDYVVMDNEAGLEHLSRRTTRDVDILLIVSDPTQRGIVAAQRVADLVDELEISVRSRYLIVNRLPLGKWDTGSSDELPPALKEAAAAVKAEFLGIVPYDATLAEFEFTGRPLIELDDHSPVYQAVRAMFKRALAQQIHQV
jgi:CO dehydrogenase maturation factor